MRLSRPGFSAFVRRGPAEEELDRLSCSWTAPAFLGFRTTQGVACAVRVVHQPYNRVETRSRPGFGRPGAAVDVLEVRSLELLAGLESHDLGVHAERYTHQQAGGPPERGTHKAEKVQGGWCDPGVSAGRYIYLNSLW